MPVEIAIAGGSPNDKSYLTWAPVAATARWVGGAPAPAAITLENGGVGKVEFGTSFAGAKTATIQLTLAADGTPTGFFVAGAYPHASLSDQDAIIAAKDTQSQAPLGTKSAMVRIRKNANTMTAAERDRYLAALGQLNARGAGPYAKLREMHISAATQEEHGDVQFLPWHRAYLLDLERELQAIDPSVAAPYWRFDQPAPALFTSAFLGAANPTTGRLSFTSGHPLTFWRTDNQPGIVRGPLFATATSAPQLASEAQTLALGASGQYGDFRALEDDPHGSAHVSFSGPINSIPTAPRDPLFFLLHANVDRLWAKWQWATGRMDPEDPAAFAPADTPRIGRSLGDTLWPWNQDTHPPRPQIPLPSKGMPSSAATPAPGAAPRLADMLDYQRTKGGRALGFDYDDVPFAPQPAPTV
jgi:tyrosinase